MTTATCCAPTVLPLRRPLLQRWWQDARDDLLEAWNAWQQRRRDEADLKTLRALDSATLRDLGLEHLVARNPATLTLRDREIGRW
ncbi:MAG: hypothetical protein KF863_07890 [Rubrivivax sp.]|nr:hypothetical protein [Rubrivivax sp.]